MSVSRPNENTAEEATPVEEVSTGQRFSLNLIGLLHGLTLGSLLPVLPLFARRSLGYSWQQTAIVVSGLAAGIIAAPPLMRVARKFKLDARLGLAGSHLGAGGLIMAMAWWRQTAEAPRVPLPLIATFCVAAYSVAIGPALRWLPQVARDVFPQPGSPGSRMWRLWAAVGCVLPAWITEAILVRVPQLRSGVASLDVLLMFAGWGSLLTSIVALLARGEASTENDAAPSLLADESSRAPMMGAGFLLAVLFLVVVQKCHHLWTAPYFDEVARRDGAAHPLVHRLVVVSQVFEVLGLYLMTGVGLLRANRVRLLLLLASSAWVARALLLSWLESAPPDLAVLNSSPLGVAFVSQMLFASQALYGLGIAGFLGAVGVLLHHSSRPAGGFRVAFLLGAGTGLGVLIGGGLAETLVSGNSSTFLAPHLRTLSERIQTGSLSMRGWSGVWLLSAAPATLALLLFLICRLPGQDSASSAPQTA